MDQGPCPTGILDRITLFGKLLEFNILVMAKPGQLVYGRGHGLWCCLVHSKCLSSSAEKQTARWTKAANILASTAGLSYPFAISLLHSIGFSWLRCAKDLASNFQLQRARGGESRDPSSLCCLTIWAIHPLVFPTSGLNEPRTVEKGGPLCTMSHRKKSHLFGRTRWGLLSACMKIYNGKVSQVAHRYLIPLKGNRVW